MNRDFRWGIPRYGAFFHREPDSVLTSTLPNGAEIAVARFPPIQGGFFKKMFAALPNCTVWITSGMSLHPMNVPEDTKWDQRIELSAFVPELLYFEGDGGQDLIAELLLFLAACPYVENNWIGPGHTLSFPDPLLINSDMDSVFLDVLNVDMPRLCSCTPGKATVVPSVVPITGAERDWYMEKGDIMALLELFEEKGVPNYFNPHRASVV